MWRLKKFANNPHDNMGGELTNRHLESLSFQQLTLCHFERTPPLSFRAQREICFFDVRGQTFDVRPDIVGFRPPVSVFRLSAPFGLSRFFLKIILHEVARSHQNACHFERTPPPVISHAPLPCHFERTPPLSFRAQREICFFRCPRSDVRCPTRHR